MAEQMQSSLYATVSIITFMSLLISINLKYAVILKRFLVFQTERGTEVPSLQIPHLKFLQHVKEFEKTTDKKQQNQTGDTIQMNNCPNNC